MKFITAGCAIDKIRYSGEENKNLRAPENEHGGSHCIYKFAATFIVGRTSNTSKIYSSLYTIGRDRIKRMFVRSYTNLFHACIMRNQMRVCPCIQQARPAPPKKRKKTDVPVTPVKTPNRKDFDTPQATTVPSDDVEWTSAMKEARKSMKRNLSEDYDDKPGLAATAKVCNMYLYRNVFRMHATHHSIQACMTHTHHNIHACIALITHHSMHECRHRLSVRIPTTRLERHQFTPKVMLFGYTASGRKSGSEPQWQTRDQ